jgi:hypothetical protein
MTKINTIIPFTTKCNAHTPTGLSTLKGPTFLKVEKLIENEIMKNDNEDSLTI